jgi:hypothetical protein
VLIGSSVALSTGNTNEFPGDVIRHRTYFPGDVIDLDEEEIVLTSPERRSVAMKEGEMISESAQQFLRSSGLVAAQGCGEEEAHEGKEITARLIDHIFQSIRS